MAPRIRMNPRVTCGIILAAILLAAIPARAGMPAPIDTGTVRETAPAPVPGLMTTIGDADSLRGVAGDSVLRRTAADPVEFLVDSTNAQWIYPVIAGSSILMFYIIYEYDQNSYHFLYDMKQRSPSVSRFSGVITSAGDGMFSIGVLAPCWLAGFITGDAHLTRVGRLGLESFLATGISVQILKHMFSRERPSEATQPGGRFHGPFAYYHQRGTPHRSLAAFDAFPSGHTATVFSLAETFSIVYDRTWVSCVAYGIATLTALSRITERTHWISDCLAGAAMGVAITRLVNHFDGDGGPVSLQPYTSNDSQGLALVLRF